MIVHRIANSVFCSNTYIIHFANSNKAWSIDCGDADNIENYLGDNGLVLEGIMLTHTHYDHIYGLPRILGTYRCPVYTSIFGKTALANDRYNFSRYHGDPISLESPLVMTISEHEEIGLEGKHRMKVYETPGHDKSCLCFLIGEYLFTGDSFIPGIKVIASFPNSDKKMAARSHNFIKSLITSETVVCPGHGDIL